MLSCGCRDMHNLKVRPLTFKVIKLLQTSLELLLEHFDFLLTLNKLPDVGSRASLTAIRALVAGIVPPIKLPLKSLIMQGFERFYRSGFR